MNLIDFTNNCFDPTDMHILKFIEINENNGKYIYSYWQYDMKQDSWIYMAFDTETKKKIKYTENELMNYCPICGKYLDDKMIIESHMIKNHYDKKPNYEIKNIIEKELQKNFKDIDIMKEINDNSHKNLNIIGNVQGGKSRIMMLISWIMIYEMKWNVILCVANMINSYNQILSRDIPQFNKWLNENGEYQNLLTIKGLRGKNDTIKKKGITLCMGNTSQMKKIQNLDQFCVITDESDTFIKHYDSTKDKSKTGELFNSIREKSLKNINVTATPFANINEENIESISIKMLSNDQYRGIDSNKITVSTFDKNEKKKLLKDDDELVNKIKIAINVCDIKNQYHYSAILINARYTKQRQKKLAKLLQKNGISSFVINSENQKPITHYKNDGDIENMKILTIQNLFDYFETDTNIYKCHILIANKMANRAISFRPSFPKKGGLIGEILVPCNFSHCTYKIQCLRLCGNYDDNYPQQYLWINQEDLNDIESEYKNIDNVWIPSNQEYGESRKQIENKEIYYIGKHDRKNVDDTKCENKFSICDKIFNTKEVLLESLPNYYKNYRIMTDDKIISIPISLDKDKVHKTYYQNKIRERCEEELKIKNKMDTSKDGLNISWDFQGKRWKQFHNMNDRFFGKNIRYCSKYIGSINTDYNQINIVIWKDGFFEKDRTDSNRTLGNIFDDTNTAFLFLTTENKWKFFSKYDHRKMGKLIH